MRGLSPEKLDGFLIKMQTLDETFSDFATPVTYRCSQTYDSTFVYVPLDNKNNNCVYPVGNPAIITQPEVLEKGDVLSEYFGLIKCTVLPPYGLHFAILPHRCGGKLTFPLCRSCVETQLLLPLTQRTNCCPHTEEERALTGTWCVGEKRHHVHTRLDVSILEELIWCDVNVT